MVLRDDELRVAILRLKEIWHRRLEYPEVIGGYEICCAALAGARTLRSSTPISRSRASSAETFAFYRTPAWSSRKRAIGHAPSAVFEITVNVARACGLCTERNETPASQPSRITASPEAWSQKPRP
jgi:hypothetical protein